MARPWGVKRVRLVPDLGDGDLYGAWGMIPQGGLLVDHTVQGNDGVPGVGSCVEPTILGAFRRYLPNSGVAGSALGAANAFALNDVTVSFWMRIDLGSTAAQWFLNYYLNATDAWGIRSAAGVSLEIFDDIDNAGASLYATTTPRGKLIHVVGVMDSLDNLFYLDGVLVGSGTASSDDWSSLAGTLYHGSQVTVTAPTEGIVGPMLIYNAAKDQSWVTQEYLKGARACQFKTSWGVRESVGNEAAGYVGFNSSPFEIITGTWQMSMDTIEGHDVKVIECIGAGRVAVPTSLFEATPTEAAFGSWRWWHNKLDASVINVHLISSDTVGDGYVFTHAADESCVLAEVGVGNVVTGGTASAGAWHQFDVSRRYDGLFNCYVDRASFGTGTDLTVTTSTYVVLDMDAGDKFAYSDQRGGHCLAKYLGVLVP